MKNILILSILLLGCFSIVKGQDEGLSYRQEPDLPKYCGQVVGPTGLGIWNAAICFKYGQDSVRIKTGELGEFFCEISELPDMMEIQVIAEGFKTFSCKYSAKLCNCNYLIIKMSQDIERTNEMIFSGDKIQLTLQGDTLEYPNPYNSFLALGIGVDFLYDLPGFSYRGKPFIKGHPIHYVHINEDGWTKEELVLERVKMLVASSKRRYTPGIFSGKNADIQGFAGIVRDYLFRGSLPYARVCIINKKDTVRLTCDALGCYFWETSKMPKELTYCVMAPGYKTYVRKVSLWEESNNICTVGLLPESSKSLNYVIISDSKIQIKLQNGMFEYPVENAFKTLEGDFVGTLLRGLPGVVMENGCLTVNGEPIHYVHVDTENFSIRRDIIDNFARTKQK